MEIDFCSSKRGTIIKGCLNLEIFGGNGFYLVLNDSIKSKNRHLKVNLDNFVSTPTLLTKNYKIPNKTTSNLIANNNNNNL